ncbi:hypothetical protein, partial [Acidiphilium sp.]|uniref:hypothetical protein n=1 Tax=Acidiphilium sp. TaxID=527 RepID=UPI0025837B26
MTASKPTGPATGRGAPAFRCRASRGAGSIGLHPARVSYFDALKAAASSALATPPCFADQAT